MVFTKNSIHRKWYCVLCCSSFLPRLARHSERQMWLRPASPLLLNSPTLRTQTLSLGRARAPCALSKYSPCPCSCSPHTSAAPGLPLSTLCLPKICPHVFPSSSGCLPSPIHGPRSRDCHFLFYSYWQFSTCGESIYPFSDVT